MSEISYASFMVRLWRDLSGKHEGAPVWIGEIESIQTGRTWQFQDVESLFDLLERQLDDSTMIMQGGEFYSSIVPDNPADC